MRLLDLPGPRGSVERVLLKVADSMAEGATPEEEPRREMGLWRIYPVRGALWELAVARFYLWER